MLKQLSSFVTRARTKATIEMSFLAHAAGGWYARRAVRVDSNSVARERAEQLRTRGYVTVPTDELLQSFVRTTYADMARAWDADDGTWRDPPTGGTYKVFLSDICERWPDVLRLADGAIGDMLRAYYGSHFQFTYVEPYRTFPAVGELPKSWLWHCDAVPPGVLKIMIYLNGAGPQSGALRVVSRQDTQEIYRMGFETRADSDRFASELERRHVVLEGGPGTAVIIDNSVLHKATAPHDRHRDVVCFQTLPSAVPEHAARERRRASRSYAQHTPQYPLLPRLY